MTDALATRWAAILERFGVRRTDIDRGFQAVVAGYSEPHRRYHTLVHVEAVLDAIDLLSATEVVEVPSAVGLAGFLHDLVYDPTRPDNEHRSAEAVEALTGRLPKPIVAETRRLIELTAGHDVAPWDVNGAVLVDADLSILGAPADVYDAYVDGVRSEYAHVPDDAFRTGRAAVLEGFAGRPQLFHTGTGRARWEEAARANLARELAALRS